MKRWRLTLGLLCAALAMIALTAAADWLIVLRAHVSMPAPTSRPIKPRPIEPADVPMPMRDLDGSVDRVFLQTHEAWVKRAAEGHIDLLFLGDSITYRWRIVGRDVWEKNYGQLNAANFGVGNSTTQYLLWEIDHGLLDGIDPKVVVLLIGTNNLRDSVASICRGETKVVQAIHAKLPHTKLLLLGILPRELDPDSPYHQKIRLVNAELARLDDGASTRFLDIGASLTKPGGEVSLDNMPDGLHPSEKGYQIWADAMRPLLNEMMQ